MAIGNNVLAHLHLFAPSLASVLAAHPEQYLYGCLSADIFIGKGCKFTPTHSHNWDMGRTLLRQADSAEAQAYAYGYLSHLAADVIAHNYLVPNILGFSAGGHLTSTALTHFSDKVYKARDAIDQASARPDFGVLVYPVISFTEPFTHVGSRTNLLGSDAAPALIEKFSKNTT